MNGGAFVFADIASGPYVLELRVAGLLQTFRLA